MRSLPLLLTCLGLSVFVFSQEPKDVDAPANRAKELTGFYLGGFGGGRFCGNHQYAKRGSPL